jgi:hypothetical protein
LGVTVKHIALKKDAPPLTQLHMELRVSTHMQLNLKNYAYNADIQGDSMPGMLIGRNVSTLLDAVNEERLLFQAGDVSLEEILGVYDKTIREVGEVPGEFDNQSEYDTIRYEYVLADEDGVVWSEIVETITNEDL